MDRRNFLEGVAGLGLSSLAKPALAAGSAKPRVAVIGGGILGAAISMRLAEAGAAVTLLEKTAPASGATSKSLAWINAFMDDNIYMKLRLTAIERWQAVDRTLGMGVVWGGYLNFTDRPEDRGRMTAQERNLAAAGHPTRAIDAAELKKVSPAIDPGDLVSAVYSTSGGHVDPVAATQRFLSAARKAGTKVMFPCSVKAIQPTDNAVALLTSRGRLAFDHVVVVAGVDAPALVAPLGYVMPLNHSPGALLHTKPLPIMTKLVYDGPGVLEWKQAADGTVVGLEASTPPPLPVHADILQGRLSDFPPGYAEMHGARILGKLTKYMPGLAQAEFGRMTVGFRPMPKDGFPIVGRLPGVSNVSVCVTHSGVTLAPLLADFIASEVLTGRPEPLLGPYRPTRFTAARS